MLGRAKRDHGYRPAGQEGENRFLEEMIRKLENDVDPTYKEHRRYARFRASNASCTQRYGDGSSPARSLPRG